MSHYADSSFLVSLVSEDTHTTLAKQIAARLTRPLPFNPMHRLEVRNAVRFAVKLGHLDRAKRFAAFFRIDDGFQTGFLVHSPINWTESLRRAELLSAAHTETLGSRSIDILHVAIALEAGAQTFLSFDANQCALAAAAGLTVQP